MQRLKIFLASSAELKEDRDRFRLFIGEQNDRLIARGTYIEVVVWEKFLDALVPDGLQKEYNRAIRECDVFVMLYFTKVGMYTAEEFETAIGAFREGGKPLIYTYFKDASVAIGGIRREDQQSLWAFQDKLKALGHYQTVYRSTEDLLLKFGGQLERVVEQIGNQSVPEPQVPKQIVEKPEASGTPVENPKASAVQPVVQAYNAENIMQLLENALDEDEFQELCNLHYPKVLKKFAAGQSQAQRVLWLWQYANRYEEVQELLNEIQKINPKSYDKYGPYLK